MLDSNWMPVGSASGGSMLTEITVYDIYTWESFVMHSFSCWSSNIPTFCLSLNYDPVTFHTFKTTMRKSTK